MRKLVWYTDTMKQIVVTVTGLNGSGKSTVAEYLKKVHGFHHISFREYMSEILTKQNLPLDRKHMRELANKLRREHGAEYVLDRMLLEASAEPKVIIESIRTTDEVAHLKNKHAYLIAVTAPSEIRYERISQRGTSTDSISYEEFIDDEKKESEGIDGSVQNLPKVLALADYLIDNQELEKTHLHLDMIIHEIIGNN